MRNLRTLAIWLLPAALLLAGCGGDDTGSGGSSTTTTGAGGGGTGGSGTGGSGTGGDAGVNGCTAADFVAATTIAFPGVAYDPPCVKVSAGDTVTWNGDFSFHPLRGGEVVDGTATPDTGSPIVAVDTGMTADVTFPTAGTFPFYCNVHFSVGMMGAVLVE